MCKILTMQLHICEPTTEVWEREEYTCGPQEYMSTVGYLKPWEWKRLLKGDTSLYRSCQASGENWQTPVKMLVDNPRNCGSATPTKIFERRKMGQVCSQLPWTPVKLVTESPLV